jgi:hypothetical protein
VKHGVSQLWIAWYVDVEWISGQHLQQVHRAFAQCRRQRVLWVCPMSQEYRQNRDVTRAASARDWTGNIKAFKRRRPNRRAIGDEQLGNRRQALASRSVAGAKTRQRGEVKRGARTLAIANATRSYLRRKARVFNQPGLDALAVRNRNGLVKIRLGAPLEQTSHRFGMIPLGGS